MTLTSDTGEKIGPTRSTTVIVNEALASLPRGSEAVHVTIVVPMGKVVLGGGQQITLSFTCADRDYARWQPEFERWLGTLTFARAAKGEAKVSDRLWTPILTGAAVGLILLLLYKHTRR